MNRKLNGNPMLVLLLAAAPLAMASNAALAELDSGVSEHSCPAEEHGGHTCACGHGSKEDHDGMQTVERMSEEMALSDDQKQQLAALTEMYRPRFKELAERGTESREAILSMAPDDPAYNSTASEMSQLASLTAAEMVTLITELQANAYALLTNEQQQQYLQLREQQRAKMEAKKAAMKEHHQAGGEPHHQCKACEWLEQDDAKQAAE